jgi:hypothetical protein
MGNSADKGVEPPFQVQELEKIHFVAVLNILIVFLDVSEHVVHVVLGRPPLEGHSSDKGRLHSAQHV